MVTAHKNPEDVPDDAEGAFPEPSDWWLADAEELNARHPRSYFIPAAERRRALRVGELVRLEFTYGPHADRDGEGHVERMWVEVLGDGRGRLRNHPARLAALAIGDLVAFEPQHVTAIDFSDEELGYAQGECPVVDKVVLQDDRAPDVVVRAEGGWWMLCREGAIGPTVETAGLLTDRFPGLEEPLRAGEGLWELAGGERGDAHWRRVSDDEIAASERWQSLFARVEQTVRRKSAP